MLRRYFEVIESREVLRHPRNQAAIAQQCINLRTMREVACLSDGCEK